MLRLSPWIGLCLALAASGCGGGDLEVAQRNRVFYAHDSVGSRFRTEYERPYPPLDLNAEAGLAACDGVEVLSGRIRISRPSDWVIRSAGTEPGRRFIQYVSPREYLVGIYERQELPEATWHEVMDRYERGVRESKGEFAHQAFPVATWNAQGRAYLVRRKVPAAKGPFLNETHEYLLRGGRNVVLLQVVHQPDGMGALSQELIRVVNSMRVL